jgi:FtsH-binding integral membrane protein
LAERLAASLPASVEAVQSLPNVWTRGFTLLAICGVVALVLGFVNTGKGWRTLTGEQRWTLALPLAALAFLLVAELAQRMTPGSRFRLRPLSLVMAAFALPLVWSLTATPLVGSHKLFYWICILFTTAGVSICAWALARYLRRGYVTEASTRLLFAGAVGLVGFTAVELFCPFVDAAHILTSHLLPGALGAGVAAWLSWKEFRR